MIIKNPYPYSNNFKNQSPRFYKLLWVGIFLIICVGLASGILASKYVQTKSYSGLIDFTATVASNYIQGLGATPEEISLEITPDNYKILKQNRELALARQVIINEEDSYVPAVFKYKNKSLQVKVRLKGHMTDHVEGDKWSLRIKVKGEGDYMGMRLFSIQHPGTRGYFYEWIYHRMLKEEGVLALRYDFVKVKINGEDYGIYAVEENFDEELVESNNRIKGPVFRFNPNLYWIDRYNDILRDRVYAPYASFQSANFVAYREGKTIKDSVQLSYYLKGMGLMEAFRRGEMAADQVFDIKKHAIFYAVMDLVGGHFSLDWSDIKFYYNPVSSRLEPVGYEACSLFPTRKLAGAYTTNQNPQGHVYKHGFHELLFNDSVFFREYINQVERISEQQFLDNFFKKVEPDLNKVLRINYREFPYKKFEKELYYQNQKSIKKILDTPKAFHAFFQGQQGDSITLQLGMIESMPVEILGISMDGEVISAQKCLLKPKAAFENINYLRTSFKVKCGLKLNAKQIKGLQVMYTIVGASHEKIIDVFPYPFIDESVFAEDVRHLAPNSGEFSFITHAPDKNEIYILPGNWDIQRDLIIPPGKRLVISEGANLNLLNGAGIFSYSPVSIIGTEDNPVKFSSPDGKGKAITVIGANGESELRWVYFLGLSSSDIPGLTGSLNFYESDANIRNCYFKGGNNQSGLNFIRAKFVLNTNLFEALPKDGLNAIFSKGEISGDIFLNCRGNGIHFKNSIAAIKNIKFDGIGSTAINLQSHSELRAKGINIRSAAFGVVLEDFSVAEISGADIGSTYAAFAAFENKFYNGHSHIMAANVKLSSKGNKNMVGEGSSIKINGVEERGKLVNVKQLISHLNE
jgi:hypothetical protein